MPSVRKGKVVLDSLRRNAVTIGSTDVPGRPTDFARQLEDMLTIKAGSILETDENAKRKLENGFLRVQTEIQRMDTVLGRKDITPTDRSKTAINQESMKRFAREISGLLNAWGKPGGGQSISDLPDVGAEVKLDIGRRAKRLK